MSKRILYLALAVIMPLGAVHPATLSNPHLLIDVDDSSGRFFLSTLEGLAGVSGDEKKNLLFFDTPPSSYTVVYVNDDAFFFGGERGMFKKPPVSVGNSIEADWENELVSVRQVVQFVRRRGSGLEDGVLITYVVKNRGERVIKAGLRVVFDTWLGEKERYHFSLSDGKKLEYESKFEGEKVPSAWLSQDSEENPIVCLQGVMRGKMVTAPSKVVFANYRSLRQNLLDYPLLRQKRFDNLPYSRNDSAVALYSEMVELAPGTGYEFRTILGLRGSEEYGFEEEEVVIIRDERGTRESPESEPEPLPPVRSLSPQEAARFVSEYSRLMMMQESLAEINEIIEEINALLGREDKSISEEELRLLKNSLMGIEKGREK